MNDTESREIFICIIVAVLLLVLIKKFQGIVRDYFNEDTFDSRRALETPFPEPLNPENQQISIENWASEDSPEAQVVRMMVRETHSKCPVMENKPKVSVCIQDPKTNKGYIVSVCCEKCIREIQTSFKRNDKVFTIRKLNNVDVLYYKNEPKQIVPQCNSLNMEGVMKLVGTKKL